MKPSQNDALESIQEIRNIMERSTKFLSLSGLSGIFAGIYALIGSYLAYELLNWGKRRFEDYGSIIYQPAENFVLWLLLDGVGMLTLSLVTAYYFSQKKANRLGVKLWNQTAKRLFINFITPLIVGGIFALSLTLKYNLVYLIAPITLLFYGLALVNAAKYSFDEIRYLGFSEIFLGIIATYFIGYGLLFWAIGFGLLHIIYGVVLFKKHQ